MRSLYEYILETDMSFKEKFELEFTINKSVHAAERQSRHGEDKENFISDDDILDEVKKAADTIIEDIIQNSIRMGSRFVVRNKKTNLNIVCQLHRGTVKDRVRVDIVTVIKTEKFWNTKESWVIVNDK